MLLFYRDRNIVYSQLVYLIKNHVFLIQQRLFRHNVLGDKICALIGHAIDKFFCRGGLVDLFVEVPWKYASIFLTLHPGILTIFFTCQRSDIVRNPKLHRFNDFICGSNSIVILDIQPWHIMNCTADYLLQLIKICLVRYNSIPEGTQKREEIIILDILKYFPNSFIVFICILQNVFDFLIERFCVTTLEILFLICITFLIRVDIPDIAGETTFLRLIKEALKRIRGIFFHHILQKFQVFSVLIILLDLRP